MVYITVAQRQMGRQMTLEEFLFGKENHVAYNYPDQTNIRSNTKTYEVEQISDRMIDRLGFDIPHLIDALADFNSKTESLRGVERKSLYNEFFIPKRSGGLRKIDAPNAELMGALRTLKVIFEQDFRASHHTSAFAYVKGRSAIDAVRRHQENSSRWFGKFDLSNFFGSTTLEFVMNMLSMIYPFSEVVKYPNGRLELERSLELAFLDGGLPQGTPISPTITNLMMIPIDFVLSRDFRSFNNEKFVYTRYADDFLISSKYDFRIAEIEKHINDVLSSFGAPFKIKNEKTRYGSSAGSNWNLGVMLNADNKITIGHKKKRVFQAMLSSFVLDSKNNKTWAIEDVQRLDGFRNYYKMVEGETIDQIVKHIGDKYGVDIPAMIKAQLSGAN